MKTKPHTIPSWATSTSAHLKEPLDSIKESGWQHEDAPSSQVVNWWMNAVYQWIKYLEECTDEVPPNLTKIRELINHQDEHLSRIDKIIGIPNGGTVNASFVGEEPESVLQKIARLEMLQVQAEKQHEHTLKLHQETTVKLQKLEQDCDYKTSDLNRSYKMLSDTVINLGFACAAVVKKLQLEGFEFDFNGVDTTNLITNNGERI